MIKTKAMETISMAEKIISDGKRGEQPLIQVNPDNLFCTQRIFKEVADGVRFIERTALDNWGKDLNDTYNLRLVGVMLKDMVDEFVICCNDIFDHLGVKAQLNFRNREYREMGGLSKCLIRQSLIIYLQHKNRCLTS